MKKNGPINEKDLVVVRRGSNASEVYGANVGRFVTLDSNEYATLCTSASSSIFGFALTENVTASSTDGATEILIDISNQPAWIKADAAVTADLIGKTCDLISTTGGNLADVGASANDIIRILDVDVDNQMVLCEIAEGKKQAAGVA